MLTWTEERLKTAGKKVRKMGNTMEDRQNSIIESFQSLLEKEELFAKVVEFFLINSNFLPRRDSEDD